MPARHRFSLKPHLLFVPGLALVLAAPSCGGGGGTGSGGGGSSTGGTPPVTPPTAVLDPPYSAGLLGAAAGGGQVRLDWLLPGPGFEAALFFAATRDGVFTAANLAGAPFASNLGGGAGTFALAGSGFFGLAVRSAGSAAWTPAGVPIFAQASATTIYVDAGASAAGADGLSPGKAFPDLFRGLLTAFSLGGGNVWVKAGTYPAALLPVAQGVSVLGGFGASFDLASRDPSAAGTILEGSPGRVMFDVQGDPTPAVLDGLVLRGNGRASVAVDCEEANLELRGVDISGFSTRGIRLRNSSTTRDFDVSLANVSSSGNGGDGFSVNGAYDLFVYGSRFDSNVQEGMETDALVALEGQTSEVLIMSSRFFGNGSEGADLDLAAPLVPGPLGGRFELRVYGSRFEQNGLEGLVIDEDFELTPGWSARIEVLESTSRANRGSGFLVDLDGPSETFFHRLYASGNGGDGLHVSSETQAGEAFVSTSLFSGNLGAGLRAIPTVGSPRGNQTLIASHCIFAGNFGGGFLSAQVEGSATSSIAYLQPNPWQRVRRTGCIEVSDPFAGTFELAAESYEQVVSRTNGTLTLSAGAPGSGGVAPGSIVELADDGTSRRAVSVNGNTVEVDPAPAAFGVPGLLTVFGPGSSVLEDYDLPNGSPAAGVGMTPPGGPPIDAGILGAPQPGRPGDVDEVPPGLFVPISTEPALTNGIRSSQALIIRFSSALNAGSVSGQRVRAVSASGAAIGGIDFFPQGNQIVVQPPAGGWGTAPFSIELNRGIRSNNGVALSAPAALPLNPL